MRVRYFNSAFICCARLVRLIRPLICSREHPVRVAFVISSRKITLERFNQLRFVAGLFVLFSQAEKHRSIRRISGEHLFEDFDS